MAAKSSIRWTEATRNPVTGCSKVSAGCAHCYAERVARDFAGRFGYPKDQPFRVTIHPERLREPFGWKRGRKVFVCSMSDLFHEEIPPDFVHKVFGVIREASRHTFQIPTKRAERMAGFPMEWPANAWAGVSVESLDYRTRVDALREMPAAVRFLSLEPLLGPMDGLDLRGIGWVIVGGESGPDARPMLAEWVRGVRDRCIEAGIPFFFKQWGGVHKAAGLPELDGRTWEQMPELPAVMGLDVDAPGRLLL